MKVTAKPIPGGWKRALNCARFTQHKADTDSEPSDKWKKRLILSEHSPLREVVFEIDIIGAEYASVMHFVRHHLGINHYVATSRPDTMNLNVSRHEQRKDDPTDIRFTINGQALINVSDRRECSCAEKKTREMWAMVKEAIRKVDPIMASGMQRRCVLRNGFCGELKPCGYCFTQAFEDDLKEYQAESKWSDMIGEMKI